MIESMNDNSDKRDDNRVRSGSVKCENPLKGSQSKSYQKPVLTVYGDVRDVTLGPTLGGGESGNAGTRCDRSNVPDNCVT